MEKILVVDDENINLMIVKRILGQDYQVMTAQSGEEALELLKQYSPSLVLLDIHMPGIDGYETFLRIRRIKRFQHVPIIFLTADDDAEAEVHGFEIGADDFIRKPFLSAVVKRRVERCLDDFRLHCNLQQEVRRQTRTAQKRRRELEMMSVEIIQTLAAAIDAKDIYTKGHSARVADYAAVLAEALGWDLNRIEKLRYKALLHDVGKIGIPDRVLNKAGKLTDEEFDVIKSHTTIGAEILKGVSSLSNMYLIAKHHHERYDGKGYPDGIAGEDIPEEARLVGIADAYDAMSSDRVYRHALPKDVIRKELLQGRGTQFDPDMLDVFLELFEQGKLDPSQYDVLAGDSESNMADNILQLLENHNCAGLLALTEEDLNPVYRFVHNVYCRYKMEYHMVLLSLTWDNIPEEEDIKQAMNAMEYSILQSLRKADVTAPVSRSQYLIVITEASEEEVSPIVERIFTGFFKNCQNVKIKPIYEII